jgi:hypothetical protein
MILLAFLVATALVCGFALIRGGAPERLVALTFLAGATASTLISIRFHFPPDGFQPAIFCVDMLMLVCIGGVMLKANRYWPIAVAALQFLSVLGHLIKLLDPNMVTVLYWIANTFWAVPQIVILGVGTIRHVHRARRPEGDPAWVNPSRSMER